MTDPVVVIGTGAGAAPLLATLAAAGHRVVALEAGDVHDPEQHAADEIAASKIYWLDERLTAGDAPQAFGGNNSGRGVGGSTLHWGAFCPRPDPRDLALRTTTGTGADWPLTLDALRPFLIEAEAAIGVAGPAHYPWDPGRQYAMPPPARNAPAQLLAHACEALGLRATDAPAALLTRSRIEPQPRLPCINCGHCHQGCRTGAKASMDVTYLPQAVRAGAEIRAGAMVHGLERDSTGRIAAVLYHRHGQTHRQPARAVFLCAGGIETPRLLLHTGLANSSGQVGRNYMAHVACQVWGTFPDATRPWTGYPSSLITEDMIRPADVHFAGGYLIQSLGILPVTWASAMARARNLWGPALVQAIATYPHIAGLGINGECLPAPGNRLTLADEVDASGMPKPLITFSYGPNEMAMERHATALMTRLWQAAGAADIFSIRRSAHTIGTCRMGHDPAISVVNPYGQSHDVPNLWICDNSVFPSAMPANPALTIMALSLRTARAFLAQTG